MNQDVGEQNVLDSSPLSPGVKLHWIIKKQLHVFYDVSIGSSLLPLDVAPWRRHMLCFYLAPCRPGSTPQWGQMGNGNALWDR